jgi:hypothetical protein
MDIDQGSHPMAKLDNDQAPFELPPKNRPQSTGK